MWEDGRVSGPDPYFYVNLSSPANAYLGDYQGHATITNRGGGSYHRGRAGTAIRRDQGGFRYQGNGFSIRVD